MLPFAIPADTTADRLFREIIPRAHAELVPASAPNDPLVVGVFVTASHDAPSIDLSYEVRGAKIAIREGAPAKRQMWIATSCDAVARVVADLNGAARLVPKFRPTSDVQVLTDPRMLRRLAMVAGSVDLAIRDLDGARMSIRIAAGDAAKRDVEDPADVTIESTIAAIEKLLAGTLTPEEAIGGSGAVLTGKRLVAMQFALALAPFFPR